MAVTLGTNAGFVSVAPVVDPEGTAVAADDVARCHKHICPSGVETITEIGWYNSITEAENNFDLGLYSHDSGGDTADDLLSSSIGNAPQGLGWNVVTGLNWSVTPGTTYWLAIQQDAHDGSSGLDTKSTGGRSGINIGATSLPEPFNSSTDNTGILAIYAVVEGPTIYSELLGDCAAVSGGSGDLTLGSFSDLAGDCVGVSGGSGDMTLGSFMDLAGMCAAVGGGSVDLGSVLVHVGNYSSGKRLVVVGNNQLEYEDINVAAGDMVELDTSSGAIDTSDQLNIFEAFQKVMVVNGGNLKVADFINVKLVHSALDTPHAKGDILTQDTDNTMSVDFTNTAKTATYGTVISGTFDVSNEVTGSGSGTAFTPSAINGMLTHAALATAHAADDTLTQAGTSATMVVEFTDADKKHTWGRITAGTFNTSGSVTGSGSGSAFTPTATDISPPLWYDWTVYQGDATNYGAMPEKAYLGCLYRGRAVLAGNPDYPHQWYMSKVANLWDWLFDSTDPLTAVAGNNADAGEIGDIIRALIPYKDDYLIFGCANSLWVLSGDPAAGGQIDSVDLTVGMFGAYSWCFDGRGNLYFFGTGGIYKVPMGFREVINLSEIDLPNLIADEDVDPTTHRITMGYDRKRYGILVCITKIADGTNSNWFYDLKTEGFFPESYPTQSGVYSMFYYAANDNDYADLLLGCTDGYIRKFAEASKDDATGASSTTPILSYVVLPIMQLSEDDERAGKLTSLTFELAGGASGGDHSDTDAVTYEIFVGDDPETVLEDIKDGATAFDSGTLTGGGRKTTIRTRARGAFMGIKLSNVTASEAWVVNRVYGNIEVAGKVR